MAGSPGVKLPGVPLLPLHSTPPPPPVLPPPVPPLENPPSHTCPSNLHPSAPWATGLDRFCCVLVVSTSYGWYVAPASQRWTLHQLGTGPTDVSDGERGARTGGQQVTKTRGEIETHSFFSRTTARQLQSWRRPQAVLEVCALRLLEESVARGVVHELWRGRLARSCCGRIPTCFDRMTMEERSVDGRRQAKRQDTADGLVIRTGGTQRLFCVRRQHARLSRRDNDANTGDAGTSCR